MDTSAAKKVDMKPTTKDPAKVFNRTIIGNLISLFSDSARPLSSLEVVAAVQQRVSELRRADGGKYSGNVKRAVLGCLQQNEVFTYEEGTWRMNPEAAQAYTERRINTLTDRTTRPRATGPKRISQSRHQRLISFLNEKLTEARSQALLRGLFRKVKESDTGEEIAHKIGLEKAIGVAQAFELVKRLYQSISREIEEQSLGTGLEKAVKEIETVASRIQSEIREIRSSSRYGRSGDKGETSAGNGSGGGANGASADVPCEVLLEKGWELSAYGCVLWTTRLGMWRDGIDSV